MSSFIFNDYNSTDDLIITQPIVRPSWAQEANEITTGSVAKIIQYSRAYDNSPLEISTVIQNTVPENIRRLYNKLRGFGKLVLSSSPDEYINAVVNVLQPQAVAQKTAELDISFTLLPFAYAVQPTITNIASEYTLVNNKGTVFSAPEIRFIPFGAGDVTIDVNGAHFIIKVPDTLVNTEIVIDCDAEVTYYQSETNKISINHMTYNAYPLLHTGENYIRYIGNVSTATVNVNERWY